MSTHLFTLPACQHSLRTACFQRPTRECFEFLRRQTLKRGNVLALSAMPVGHGQCTQVSLPGTTETLN